MATQSLPRISEDEYLRRDRAADYKSELVGGEMFAMSGGSLRHSRVGMNCGIHLGSKLSGEDCRVFSRDARIRTVLGEYVYPDVSVVCGTPLVHGGTDDLLTNPVVVIEVLSPSTTAYDRGRKFQVYRELASLREYVLSHVKTPHVEVYSPKRSELDLP